MSADPHLLPDGSTSWGPDPERHRNEGPGGCVPWEEVESLRASMDRARELAEESVRAVMTNPAEKPITVYDMREIARLLSGDE